MTPPISRLAPSNDSVFADRSSGTVAKSSAPSPDQYIAPPTVALPLDITNPFSSSRPMATAGDALDVILKDFVAKHLVDAEGRGAEIAMTLGSFPGNLHPELPIHQWDPDKKIDAVVWGDAEVMIRKMAESHRWDRPGRNNVWDRLNINWITQERNITFLGENIYRPRFDPAKHKTVTDFLVEYVRTKGLVYLPIQVQTPQGPVTAKIGILDRGLWNQGFESGPNGFEVPRGDLMASQRAALLPINHGPGGTYHFIRGQVDQKFLEQVRLVQADYAQHALKALAGRDQFTGQELIAQRYQNQFAEYDRTRSRFFREAKKAKQQLERYQSSNPKLPAEILAPAFVDALKTMSTAYEVSLDGKVITPDEINADNLAKLTFRNKLPQAQRKMVLNDLEREYLEINKRLWPKSWFNVSSGKYARPNPNAPHWFKYFLRKIGVLKSGLNPASVSYAMDASHFTGNPEEITLKRLGRTGVPLDWNVVVSGYDPKDETDPEVRQKMVSYVEAELQKGKEPNILIYGNNPSKFTFPMRGVPVVAYRMMEALRSPAIKTCVVVGTPDVMAVFNAFKFHFIEEITRKGKVFIPENVGPEGGSFSGNIKAGLDFKERGDGMAVLTFGDVPFGDIHNIAYHPWRHHMDYIFGTNGRDLLTDFMGMNAHYQGELEGVKVAFKEGNIQGARTLPFGFVQEIFGNRKSMTGVAGKILIVGKHFLFSKDVLTNLTNVAHLFADLAVRSGRNLIYRAAGLQTHPKGAFDGGLLEEGFSRALRIKTDFRATHIDPKPPVDVDGWRDYVLSIKMAEIYPHEYQAELENFAKVALQGSVRKYLPALDHTPQRMNQVYLQVYHDLLEREGMRVPRGELGLGRKTYQRALKIGKAISVLPKIPVDMISGLAKIPRSLPGVGKFYQKGVLDPFSKFVYQPWARNISGPLASALAKHYERQFGLEYTEKLGITEEFLKSKAIDPNILPFLDDGKVNPQWMEMAFPKETLERYRRAFAAYDNRANHAEGLEASFRIWNQETVPPHEKERVPLPLENTVLRVLSSDPEFFRGLILEWDFDRLQNKVMEIAEKKGGLEKGAVADYFHQSLVAKQDTSLRRVLTGFKAVDVLRRYESFLSPAEFQTLYPQLVESIKLARQAVPGNRWTQALRRMNPALDGKFLLRGYFDAAQKTVDRTFVRKVGESPPPYRGRGLASRLSHSNNREAVAIKGPHPKHGRVDTAVWLPADVELFSRRMEILPSRIPHLMAAASKVQTPENLNMVSRNRMTPERLLAWANTAEGMQYLKDNQKWLRDGFANRIMEWGPGLASGLGALWLFEKAADKIGIDPLQQPHERFMFVVGGSHLVSAGIGGWHEVYLNQEEFKAPFDFVRQRSVQAGSEGALQYSLESRGGRYRAGFASVFRNFAGPGGLPRGLLHGARGLATLPLRAPWNMGAGLMSSALTDRILSEGILDLEEGSQGRRAIQLGSFFLPDVYRIAVGNGGPALFRTRGMRLATRAFALGFMADLAFTLGNRIQHGSEAAVAQGMIYQHANELHDAASGSGLLDGAFEMMAPQMAAWWDSVKLEGGSFKPNGFQREAQEALKQFSLGVRRQARSILQQRLVLGLGEEAAQPQFYQRVDLGFLQQEKLQDNAEPQRKKLPTRIFYEHLKQNPGFAEKFAKLSTLEEQAKFLQRQYSAWNLSPQDAETVLFQVAWQDLRKELGQLATLPMGGNAKVKELFDEKGRLRADRDRPFLTWVFSGEKISKKEILHARREVLARRLEELRKTKGGVASKELKRLEAVARQIGLSPKLG